VRNIWSFEIGDIAGVTVRVHLTFIALLLWVLVGFESVPPLTRGIVAAASLITVLLHEVGHALVARLYGVKTYSVSVYPFGGVVSLGSIPSPTAEIAISLSGPLLNGLIAAMLIPLCSLEAMSGLRFFDWPLPAQLVLLNGGLAIFNLIPALPLDGGRFLKALLALCKVTRASLIVSRTSQVICLVLAIVAFFQEQPAIFIGAFIVFFGALQEYVRSESRSAAAGFTAADAMIPRSRLESFTHGTTVSTALRVALTSLHPLYPVQIGDELIGVVFREDILEHAAMEPDAYLSAVSVPLLQSIAASAPLTAALSIFESTGAAVLVVMRDEDFVGLLVHDRVAEFVIMQSVKYIEKNSDDVPWSVPM